MNAPTGHTSGIQKVEMTSLEQMNANMIKEMEKQGYTHYKARAECFHDVISAFNIIHKYNRDKEGHHIIRLISPTIKGSPMGDAVFDFWTESPIKTIQTLWDTYGRDLHRIIQTIKPFDKYDGKTDSSFWDKPVVSAAGPPEPLVEEEDYEVMPPA